MSSSHTYTCHAASLWHLLPSAVRSLGRFLRMPLTSSNFGLEVCCCVLACIQSKARAGEHTEVTTEQLGLTSKEPYLVASRLLEAFAPRLNFVTKYRALRIHVALRSVQCCMLCVID